MPELENIDGLANVEVFGSRQKSVAVIFDEKACEEQGITPSQIRNRIRQYNQTKSFVGQVVSNNNKLVVNVSAEYQDIQD